MTAEIASPIAPTRASLVLASAFRKMPLIFEKASLPLSVSSRHISWMTPKEAEDGLRMLAAGDGSRGIAPRPQWRPRPLMEIGEKSLRREPSAGRSEGGVATEVWRWR